MLNHKQTAMALAVIVLMISSTFVPSAYAQLHGSPINPGSHPIIRTFIGPAVKVVGLIIGMVKSHTSLPIIIHSFTHFIDRP